MLVTRDIVGFVMPVFNCSRCFSSCLHPRGTSTTIDVDPTISSSLGGATEADHHHHHRRCRRLRSTRRSWRFPVKHPLSLTASQDGVGVCTVHTLQPGKSVLASITQVRVVYTHRVPQREVSVSIYKLYLWKLCLLTGGTAWQHSGETGIHLAPPGAPLDAVHIAGCFKFLALEELSCVIFPPKRVLSSDWNTVGALSFFVIWGVFSSRWKKGECESTPFRGARVWNSLSVTLFPRTIFGSKQSNKRCDREIFKERRSVLSRSETLAVSWFFFFFFFCSLLRLSLLAVKHTEIWKWSWRFPLTTIRPAYKVRSSRWQVLCIKGMKLNLWGTCSAEARLPVKTNTISSNVTRKPEH